MNRVKVLLAAAASALSLTSTAHAGALLKVSATGTLSGIDASGAVGVAGATHDPTPFSFDAVFDLALGFRNTTPGNTDQLLGWGGTAPGSGTLFFDGGGSAWGRPGPGLTYLATFVLGGGSQSSVQMALSHPSDGFSALFTNVTVPGLSLDGLDTLPTGNLCESASTCRIWVGKDQSFGGLLETFTVRGVVPEPRSWALMILGFTVAGTLLRRRPGIA